MTGQTKSAQELVESLQGGVSARKLRLFACGRCRRYWSHLTDNRSRNAVEVAERLADNLASENERLAALELADTAAASEAFEDSEDETIYLASVAAAYTCHSLWDDPYIAAHATAPPLVIPDSAEEAEAIAQLCDVFGEPIANSTPELSPYPPEVLQLAQAIYDERAFERLPELAEALASSGCASAEMLSHCRNGRGHIRGCWVIDRILGKH